MATISKPQILFWDTETGGFEPRENQLFSIGTTIRGQPTSALYAQREENTFISAWAEKHVWNAQKNRLGLLPEKDIIQGFISQLNQASEQGITQLAGWNTGYGSKGRGFDIPFITTRATLHGLQGELQGAFSKFAIRDIGQEYAVKLGQELGAYESLVGKGLDPAFYRQTQTFLEGAPGGTVSEIAQYQATASGKKMSGWKQEIMASLRNIGYRPHEVEEDIRAGMQLAEQSEAKLFSSELDVHRWNVKAFKNALISQAIKGPDEGEVAKGRYEGMLARAHAVETSGHDIYKGFTSSFVKELEERVLESGGSLDLVKKGFGMGSPKNIATHAAGIAGVAIKAWKKPLIALGIATALWTIKPASVLKEETPTGEDKTVTSVFSKLQKALPKYGQEIGTGHKRILFPKSLISEEELEGQLGFVPVKVAIPESGQSTSISWRNPENLYHLHSHGDSWTMHKDRHAASTMTALAAAKKEPLSIAEYAIETIKGLPHVITEGLPGLKDYLWGKMSGAEDMAARLKEETPRGFNRVISNLGKERISGRDDDYNTIEGLPHGGMAEESRHQHSSFGSGWTREEQTSRRQRAVEAKRGGKKVIVKGHTVRNARDAIEQREEKRKQEKAKHNTIEGLNEQGLAATIRKALTDFGSGYQGLPSALMGQKIDPRVLAFRRDVLDDKEKRQDLNEKIKKSEAEALEKLSSLQESDFVSYDYSTTEGIDQRRKDLKAIRLSDFRYEVEDADTIVLKRGGKDISIRLAGLDAPETASHSGDPLEDIRIEQNQPGGREATEWLRQRLESDNPIILVDPTDKTYGRHLGAVISQTGENISLEMVKKGVTSALPFGSESKDVLDRTAAEIAQKNAQSDRRGIWALKRYQAVQEIWEGIGRPLTHNTLTRLDKVAGNLNIAATFSYLEDFGSQQGELSQRERQQARRMGSAIQKSRTRNSSPSRDPNTIEGMKHGGMASQTRPQFGFGSRSILNRVVNFASNLFGRKSRGALSDIFGRNANKILHKGISEKEFQDRMARWIEKNNITVSPKGLGATSSTRTLSYDPEATKQLGFQYGLSQEELQAIQPVIFGHEALELVHRSRQIGRSIELPKFGTHATPAIIGDELTLAASLGETTYSAMKKFRLAEASSKPGTPYQEIVNRIVTNFEKKQLPKFRNIPKMDSAYSEFKAMGEEPAMAAQMRHGNVPGSFNSGFRSKWIRRALEMGMGIEKVAASAERLGQGILQGTGRSLKSEIVSEYGKSGIEGAIRSAREAQGITVEGQRWILGSQLGEKGTFGSAFRARRVSGGIAQEGVAKIGNMEPGGEIDKLSQAMRGEIEQEGIFSAQTGKGMIGRMGKMRTGDLGAKKEAVEMATFAQGYTNAMITQARNEGLSPLTYEAFMTKEARKAGYAVPDIYASSDKVIIQEHIGSLEGLKSRKIFGEQEEIKKIDWLLSGQSGEFGKTERVVHLDPSPSNVQRRGGKFYKIDYGTSVMAEEIPEKAIIKGRETTLRVYKEEMYKQRNLYMAEIQKSQQKQISEYLRDRVSSKIRS